MDWIHAAQDMGKQHPLVNTVMELRERISFLPYNFTRKIFCSLVFIMKSSIKEIISGTSGNHVALFSKHWSIPQQTNQNAGRNHSSSYACAFPIIGRSTVHLHRLTEQVVTLEMSDDRHLQRIQKSLWHLNHNTCVNGAAWRLGSI